MTSSKMRVHLSVSHRSVPDLRFDPEKPVKITYSPLGSSGKLDASLQDSSSISQQSLKDAYCKIDLNFLKLGN
ncbi:MAG: hypothetical protein HYX72_00875 [Acidobacteria bacterium]|nr:hypothetical protein [Acidobacteriota bacterium]